MSLDFDPTEFYELEQIPEDGIGQNPRTESAGVIHRNFDTIDSVMHGLRVDLDAAPTEADLVTAAAAAASSAIATIRAGISSTYDDLVKMKAYVDGIVAASDAMVFKGTVDCSANPNYPAADRGWTYKVSVAGLIGGASGAAVEVNDILICLTDGTASGNEATVGPSAGTPKWTITQGNIDGAVIGPTTSITDGRFALWDTTNRKLKQSASSPGALAFLSTIATALLDANAVTMAKIEAAPSGGVIGATAAGNYSHRTYAQVKTSLAYGNAADQNTGTSGGNVPLLNGNNTHSGNLDVTGLFKGKGVATNTSPGTGYIGEPLRSVFGSTDLPNGAYTNMGSRTFTAGDWDIGGKMNVSGKSGSMTSIGKLMLSVSLVSATVDFTEDRVGGHFLNRPDSSLLAMNNNGFHSIIVPRSQFLFTTTTTVYLVGYTDSDATLTATSICSGRRMS